MSDLIHIKRIVSVCSFDLAPSFATESDMHDDWEFMYVDSGQVICTVDDHTQTLHQGDILFHRPGEMHRTVCNGKHSASIFTVIFECRSCTMSAFAGAALTVPDKLMPVLGQISRECISTFNVSVYPLTEREGAPIGGEQVIRNRIEEFLILLLRSVHSVPELGTVSARESSEGLAAEIRRYLEAHLYDRVTIDGLTEEFHFGKTYICQRFKKSVGTSVLDYHIDLKITEAKRLLREERVTVREIADRLGFESAEYFSRCFKKRTGYSPISFRRMLITSAKVKRK